MTIPTKTLKSGFSMPVYGIGTWMMGGAMEHDPNNDDAKDIAAIKQALDAGVTHIDTAEAYAAGHAEKIVGQAIKDYNRKDLFIVSKAKRENQSHELLLQSLHNSLERLGTDYLDLYLLHAPSRTHPIEETMAALDEAKESGLIKEIGVSNFTIKQLELAQSLTKNKIVANQLHLNVKFRETEIAGLVDHAQQNDWMFIAWRPLQKGAFLDNPPAILTEMAKKYDKTPAQIAINWLISQDNIVTLSKTRDHAHLNENLGALGWEMETNDIEKIRNDFPNQEAVSDAVPLEEWA